MKPEHRRVTEIMSEGLFCAVLMRLFEKVNGGTDVYVVRGSSHRGEQNKCCGCVIFTTISTKLYKLMEDRLSLSIP